MRLQPSVRICRKSFRAFCALMDAIGGLPVAAKSVHMVAPRKRTPARITGHVQHLPCEGLPGPLNSACFDIDVARQNDNITVQGLWSK